MGQRHVKTSPNVASLPPDSLSVTAAKMAQRQFNLPVIGRGSCISTISELKLKLVESWQEAVTGVCRLSGSSRPMRVRPSPPEPWLEGGLYVSKLKLNWSAKATCDNVSKPSIIMPVAACSVRPKIITPSNSKFQCVWEWFTTLSESGIEWRI